MKVIALLIMILNLSYSMFITTTNAAMKTIRKYHKATIKMMPEGPEVQSLVDKLNYYYSDKQKYQLVSSSIISGRYTKVLPVGFNETIVKLPLTLKSINSKGKFIYLKFDKDISLWCTLGLTGGFSFSPKANHIRYTLTFQDSIDNTKKTLYFYDQRNFGTLKCCFSNDELQIKLDSLGPCWVNDLSLIHISEPTRPY